MILSDLVALLFGLAITATSVIGLVLAIRYTHQKQLKKIPILTYNLQLGIDYLRRLESQNLKGEYPKLYRSLQEDARQLDILLDKYSNKIAPQQYQESMQLIHVVSALPSKNHFLADVTDGVLNLVNEFFPEAEKLTTKFRPKDSSSAITPASIYQASDEKLHKIQAKLRYVQEIAPEVVELYTALQRYNQQITEKLETSSLSNKTELLAIHEGNMRNLNDVFDGYIKIKEAPSDYFQAPERLEKARSSLEKGREILQETLRQINEDDLMNFEISLRLLQNER